MKILSFFSILTLISFQSYSQVNRYTTPPPVAQYSPMNLDELKFAPTNKKQAADQNFEILQEIAYGMAEYVEQRGSDEKLIEELTPYARKIEQLAVSDLSNKRSELINLNEDLKKIFRNYEQRQSTSVDTYFVDISGLFKIKNGALVVSKPIKTTVAEDAEPLGFAKTGEIKVIRKANDNYFEVDYKGEKGYILRDLVKIN